MRSSVLKSILFLASVFLAFSGAARADEAIAAVSPAPSPQSHHLQNISARARVQTDQNVLIAGFIVTGTAPKNVLVRALGPSLSVNGVPIAGRLTNPTLELYAAGSNMPIAQNDDWRSGRAEDIQSTGLAPSNDLESAIVRMLDPGQYTAVVRGRDNGTGVGLIDAFELTAQNTPKFANISTRGFVGSGDNALIGGFIVGGGGGSDATMRVLVRGIGPSLNSHGIAGALSDPTIELFNANGVSLGFNDNWHDIQETEIYDTGLAPDNDFEAALVSVLAGGNYTAVLRGRDGGTGTGLIEIYEVPNVTQLPGGVAGK